MSIEQPAAYPQWTNPPQGTVVTSDPSTFDTSPLEMADAFESIKNRGAVYAVALKELQALESKPVCHRTAAKLLVSDCQLLDGKNEATIHDSGRRARDFVDFYAAAMAICDLERASFTIPEACGKFREASLAKIATPVQPTLHVTSGEIDACLQGLARVSAAWGTWVSYRHMALNFCEAARGDYVNMEKIHLYERLTDVLNSLANGAEDTLDAFHTRLEEATQRLSRLSRGIDELQDRIQRTADAYVSSVQRSRQEATNLERLLGQIFRSALETHAEMSFHHEKAVATIIRKAEQDLEIGTSFMAAIGASSASLEAQLGQARLDAIEISQRQLVVEQSLLKSLDMATEVSAYQVRQRQLLIDTTNQTEEILRHLNNIAPLSSFFSRFNFDLTSLWLPVVSPILFLVAGNFGFSPSLLRNIALLGLGEGFGMMLTYILRRN